MGKNKEKEQVVILKDSQDLDPFRLTWNRFLNNALKYKYWILSFSLLGILGGYVLSEVIYNPTHTNFETEIVLKLNGSSISNDEYLFGGKKFDFKYISSQNNLNNINNSIAKEEDKFDIDSIQSNIDLKVERLYETERLVPYTYVISGNANEIGEENIKRLVDSLVQEAIVSSFSFPDANAFNSNRYDYATFLNSAINLESIFVNNLDYLNNFIAPNAYVTVENKEIPIKQYINSKFEEYRISNHKYMNSSTLSFTDNSKITSELAGLINTFYAPSKSSTNPYNSYAFVNIGSEQVQSYVDTVNSQIDLSIQQQVANKEMMDAIDLLLDDPELDNSIQNSLRSKWYSLNNENMILKRQIDFDKALVFNASRAPLSDNSSNDDKEYYQNKSNYENSINNYVTKMSEAYAENEKDISTVIRKGYFHTYYSSSFYELKKGLNPALTMLVSFTIFTLLGILLFEVIAQYKLRNPKKAKEEITVPKQKDEFNDNRKSYIDLSKEAVTKEEDKKQDFDPNQKMFKD